MHIYISTDMATAMEFSAISMTKDAATSRNWFSRVDAIGQAFENMQGNEVAKVTRPKSMTWSWRNILQKYIAQSHALISMYVKVTYIKHISARKYKDKI